MLAYSARKNSANAMPEYSTWKPATISDSPSATSKGARLVSATPEMKYTINSGNSQNHHRGRHGNHRPGRERGHECDDGREPEQELVRIRRDDDFLRQELDHVGERLAHSGQQTKDAHPVRSAAQLHPADDLALPQGQ